MGVIRAVSAALDVVPQGSTALVAVSGGPDSTALLYLAAEARCDLSLVVGHVRHGLRDDAQDAEVAAGHAAALGVPFYEQKVVVNRQAPEGLEAAARVARYEALAAMAHGAEAAWLFVGHTADDQAETVLLNIARGSGIRGLSGMPPVRDLGGVGVRVGNPHVKVARPLLQLERARIRAFTVERGLRTVQDPTNADVKQRRARARHETLPLLAALTGHPEGIDGLVRALVRLAALARDDADALDTLAAAQAQRLIVQWGPVQTVSTRELAALPRALAGRVVRRMLAKARADRARFDGLDAESVWAVLALRPGEALHVPGGVWVTAGGGWLAAAPPGLEDLPERSLAVPGATPIPELDAVLLVGAAAGIADAGQTSAADLRPPGATGPTYARVPCGAPLVVRARHPGDRMGSRRLADLMSGVPRAARGLVPVVTAAHDVRWAPGIAVAEGTAGIPMRLCRLR
jgi:tRNA(Ile)-lysidine synthase